MSCARPLGGGVRDKPREHWLWGGASLPGGRNEQQDRWGVFTTTERDGLLAVVADGLGGHRDGAQAAQAVVETANQFLCLNAGVFRARPKEALVLLCKQAQAAVVAASTKARSTIVVLWLYQDQAHWMHVGDSRCYHFRDGQRLSRTRDHSAAQILVDLGEISEAEIANHPDQNRLYRSLGEGMLIKPEIGEAAVMEDDLLVLCSDGVWSQISDQEVWTVTHSGRLEVWARDLVKRAINRAGVQADNATLVLIRPRQKVPRGWAWFKLLRGG